MNIYNMPGDVSGLYLNTWPVLLSCMLAQITATAEFLIAAYLSFKENKYTTLSYGQRTFCFNKSTPEA